MSQPPRIYNRFLHKQSLRITIFALLLTLIFAFTSNHDLPHPLFFLLGGVSYFVFYRCLVGAGIFTPCKDLHEEIERERSQILNYLDSAGVIFISLDREANITLINPKGCEVLRCNKEEVLGRNWFELFSTPNRRQRHQERFAKIIAGTTPIRGKLETTLRSNGGDKRIIRWNNVLLTDADGLITGTFSTGEDISAIRAGELAIENARQNWEQTFDAVSYEIAIIDKDNSLIQANRALAAALGVPKGEAIGLSCRDLLYNKEDRSKCLHCLTKEDLAPHTVDIFIKPLNKHYQISTSLISPDMGRDSNIVYIAQDMTERKRNEFELRQAQIDLEGQVRRRTQELSEANKRLEREIERKETSESSLRESEKKFKALSQEFNTLLDAIPDILLLVSADKEIIWANKGAADTFGLDPQTLAGNFCHDFLPCKCGLEDDDVDFICPVHLALDGEATRECQQVFPDNSIKIFRSFPILDEHGKTLNVILVGTDITDRLIMEKESIRNRHLSSIGELAAGVAHEINNPINGIINYAQLIINDAAADSQCAAIAQRIIKEGDRIAAIVSSLLSFARAPKTAIKTMVSIKEIINDVLALTEYKITRDNILIKQDIPEDIRNIYANQHQVEQVFLNLVNNASYALNEKYPAAAPDKIMEISAGARRIDDVDMVGIMVRDHGTGIPEDIRESILNPFFSTKPQGSGTGLGLSISHGIISEHKGRLFIDSVPGKYSAIEACFPIEEESVEP